MPNHPPTDGSWRHQLGSDRFPVAPNRYHLYIGLFCPFAHRALIARELKGLQQFLPISVVAPYPKEPNGWRFPSSDHEYLGATVDHLYGSKFLREIYFKSDANYTGKYSVPVLWDKETQQIVNNESEDIMRMLCTCFNPLVPSDGKQAVERKQSNFYPEHLRLQIDNIGSWMGPGLNSGVYRAGFAETQDEYEKGCRMVFSTLDRLESMLVDSNTILMLDNKILTTVDIKLYTTLIRFDAIYQQHFKLMIRSVRHGYPCLHRWMKNLYWNVPGIKETTNFRHIKENYTKSHAGINPKAITPLGPDPEVEKWTEEDERWKRGLLGVKL